MKHGTIRTVRSVVRDVDPLRALASAEVSGRCFFLKTAPDGAVIIKSHSGGQVIGKIVPARNGGDVFLGDVRIGEYLYSDRDGYLVVPVNEEQSDMPRARSEHPVDYLLRHAVQTS